MTVAPATKLQTLTARAQILRAIRAWFEARDFIEIEAPVAVHSPGLEPHLLAFELHTEGPRRYLHTSPEYALKRLLGEGFERIFSLAPCFRDEPPSATHSPEFTMLEWYQVGLDLPGLMDQTEQLVAAAYAAIPPRPGVPDLSVPFRRLTVRDAFIQLAGVDPWALSTADALRDAGRAAGIAVPTQSDAWDDVFFQIFLNTVEPALAEGPPTFLWGWPASQAALARLDPKDPSTALRFELFAGGIELANAFDELTDPAEQRARFEQDQAHRRALGVPVPPLDEALLTALAKMRPTSGIALGIDRLVMLILGVDNIAEVRPQAW